jgi:hypothetical protein
MTGIHASMLDETVLTMMCVVVTHQYQQMKQMLSMCERSCEVTENNLWTKLHQRLEFLLEAVRVFFMMC